MRDLKVEFECHVTMKMKTGTADQALDQVVWGQIAKNARWKTSHIVGDPLLGKDGFFYFTTHSNDYKDIFSRMGELCKLLEINRFSPCRKKIEQIVYDTKRSLFDGPATLEWLGER